MIMHLQLQTTTETEILKKISVCNAIITMVSDEGSHVASSYE
jgi:hypothetical protein